MYDTNSAVQLGIVGAFPSLVMLIADAAPGIASWGDVAAAGVVFSLFVWLLTVHIPGREKASEARQDARDAAQEKRLDRIHAEFLTALQTRDETSRVNAANGHGAMQRVLEFQRDVVESNRLTKESFEQLHDSIKMMCEKIDSQSR